MRQKIIIASDSFKGSLTALEVGQAAAAGIKSVFPDIPVEILPVADGGEGTLEAIAHSLHGQKISVNVTGPLGDPLKAEYLVSDDTAIIEMAAASGLTLIPSDKRDPLHATSRGTGELIRDALSRGCRKFLIAVGGSATNDAGTGMLSALGFRFLDKDGIPVGPGGGEAARIRRIDSSEVIPQLSLASFTVACDVSNPLTGPEGASCIFAPQKGADRETVEKLDKALSSFASVARQHIGRDFSKCPGAGAAGGLGFAFLAFLGATLQPGIDMVLDTIDFNRRLNDATLVITGEGRLDMQTCMGKAPYGVLHRCRQMGIPVVGIGGAVLPESVETLMSAGFTAVLPIVPGPMSLHKAMSRDEAFSNVKRTAAQIIRLVSIYT